MGLFWKTGHMRHWRYVPLVLWVVVIFINSSSSGSMNNTSRFIRPLLEFLFPAASEEMLIAYHAFIRKFAHFAEYAILAFCGWMGFSSGGNSILKKAWPACAFLLVATIASLDEFNQSFNSQRSGSLWDVALDCAGGASMIASIYFFSYLRQPKS